MQALLNVVLPVFLVIGFGYVAVWRGLFSDTAVDGLMRFATHFAIPCLLFSAIATLDLQQNFDLRMLGSFYAGAAAGFFVGLFGARLIFGRDWEDAVVIGFCCLFSNTVLIGLPLIERAYDGQELANSFAIVALHSPFCYGLGITVMEIVRNRGRGVVAMTGRVGAAIFSNALMIAIALGFAVNLSGLPVPAVIDDALEIMVRAALPAALFALGGVLCRYRPEGDLRLILFVCAVALVFHPVVVWMLGSAQALDQAQMRAAVVTSAMAPGINGYVFATLYGRAMRVAASSVLLATALSILTAWAWLAALG